MKLFPAFACSLVVLSSPLAAGQDITVSWRDKPPYHYVDGARDRGFLLARGKAVFAQAGVPARFVMEPSKRIWASFQSGKTNYCSLGRYRMPERDAFAQYSRAIHMDPPQVLLVSQGALPQVRKHKSLAALLADPGFELGLTDGTSLGPQLDALVAGSANTVTRRTVEASTLIRMVAAGRMSYTIADRYGWDYLRARDPRLAGLTVHVMPDMPGGLARYIMCSKDIPAATMARLDKALEQLRYADKPPTAAELAK
jgi:polar amino acid transport system substrate-binding protein